MWRTHTRLGFGHMCLGWGRPSARSSDNGRRWCHQYVVPTPSLENWPTPLVEAASAWASSGLLGHSNTSEVDFTAARKHILPSTAACDNGARQARATRAACAVFGTSLGRDLAKIDPAPIFTLRGDACCVVQGRSSWASSSLLRATPNCCRSDWEGPTLGCAARGDRGRSGADRPLDPGGHGLGVGLQRRGRRPRRGSLARAKRTVDAVGRTAGAGASATADPQTPDGLLPHDVPCPERS
jgi:hypothetical protein